MLLASLGRCVDDYDQLVVALYRVHREVIALDLPGVGGVPDLDPGADLHDLVGSVAARLAGEGAEFHLIGHAFGNRVARCLAADHPSRVASLSLLGCGGRYPGEPEARSALRRCFTEEAGSPAHREAVATAFFAPTSEVPSSWETGWWRAAADAQRRAAERTPVADWWEPPPRPVLVLVGGQDRISPPANAADLVDRLGPRGHLEVIARAGHALLPEQPTAVAEAVLAFLAAVDP